MDVLEAIKGRASTRAFLDKPVPQETVRTILETARWAPSGVNSQPWQVAAVAGEVKRRIGDAIVAALNQGQKPNPDYHYYSDQIPKSYRSRQVACGKALYGALGIERDDKQGRKEQWLKNYHGFGAPLELFVFIDDVLEKGSWVDMGMFIQNIMLAARGCGLETCPQAAMAEFPDIVRETLGLPKTLKLVCGIAVGYADRSAPVNRCRTEREPVDAFTKWFGWET
jgi:nitroreductase